MDNTSFPTFWQALERINERWPITNQERCEVEAARALKNLANGVGDAAYLQAQQDEGTAGIPLAALMDF